MKKFPFIDVKCFLKRFDFNEERIEYLVTETRREVIETRLIESPDLSQSEFNKEVFLILIKKLGDDDI